jgi:hypothetical protein
MPNIIISLILFAVSAACLLIGTNKRARNGTLPEIFNQDNVAARSGPREGQLFAVVREGEGYYAVRFEIG